MKTYWAIEDKKGKLVSESLNYNSSGEAPILFDDEDKAMERCWLQGGERPVKIEIRKIGDSRS